MSAETAAWVEAQNKVTFPYLEAIPVSRSSCTRASRQLNEYPKYSSPSRKGPYYFFSKNDGLQNQSVLYIQKGLDGTPEVLIDPNKWSEDGTTQARRVRAVHRREVRGLRHLEERLRLAAVQGDGAGDEEDAARHARLGQGLRRRVARRRLLLQPLPGAGEGASREGGDQRGPSRLLPQGRHAAVAGPADLPGRGQRRSASTSSSTTDDERFALLTVSDRGKGKDGNALFARDLSRGEREFNPVVRNIGNDSYGVVDNVGDKLLVETNKNAPNGRVVLVDPRKPDEANWKAILPERTGAAAGRQHRGRQALRDAISRT